MATFELVNLNYDTRRLKRMENAFSALGSGQRIQLVLVRALTRAGDQATTAMSREIVKQTGLRKKTIDRALKKRRPFNDLVYKIQSKGGNIRLKFFRPRETKKGLTAYPRNKKTLYPGVFMKGGQFPKRKGGIGVPVIRAGKSRLPLRAAPRSGVFIPDEMIKGGSEQAFYRTAEVVMLKRIDHELYRLLGSL